MIVKGLGGGNESRGNGIDLIEMAKRDGNERARIYMKTFMEID